MDVLCGCGCGSPVKNNGDKFLQYHHRRKSPIEFLDQDGGYATPCWIWQRAKSKQGYGMVTIQNKQYLVHVLKYEAIHGSVPEGLELDHLCRNRNCVNPDHLEAVSHVVNLQRGAMAKLNHEIVAQARDRYASGESQSSIARSLGVTSNTISMAMRGRTWKAAVA